MTPVQETDSHLTGMRKAFNGIEQSIGALPKRRESALAFTACQLATMWLGKAKGALGANTPYPASFDSSSPVIEPRADVAGPMLGEAFEGEIAKVKELRF